MTRSFLMNNLSNHLADVLDGWHSFTVEELAIVQYGGRTKLTFSEFLRELKKASDNFENANPYWNRKRDSRLQH